MAVTIFGGPGFDIPPLGGGPSVVPGASSTPTLEGPAGPKPDLSYFESKKGPQFGAIQISASTNEDHEFKAKVTRYPIEASIGPSIINDHRTIEPVTLSIDAIITDMPLNLIEEALGTPPNQIGKFQDRETPTQIFNQLLRMHEVHAVFTVVTGLRVYKDMTFTSLNVKRNGQNGKVVEFSADLQQLEFVTTKAVPAVIFAKAQKKTDAGDQVKDTTQPMDCVDNPSSFLLDLFADPGVTCSPRVMPKPLAR